MSQHFLHSGDVGSCRDGEGGCCMAAAVIGEVFLYPCLVLDAVISNFEPSKNGNVESSLMNKVL